MACHSAHLFFLPSLQPVTFLWDCPRKELGNDFHFPWILDNFSVHVLLVDSFDRITGVGRQRRQRSWDWECRKNRQIITPVLCPASNYRQFASATCVYLCQNTARVKKEERFVHQLKVRMQHTEARRRRNGRTGLFEMGSRREIKPHSIFVFLSFFRGCQWSHISIGNITIVSTATNVMLQNAEISIFKKVGGKHKCGACRGWTATQV